jgi:hypothetical protein
MPILDTTVSKLDQSDSGFLFGYYPGSTNPEITSETVRHLLESGFRYFVDLTQKGELHAYDETLAEEASTRGLQVVYRRCPIPKGHIPHDPLVVAQALSLIEEGLVVGSKVYIHGAREGVERCIIVAACWFQDRGLSLEDALKKAVSDESSRWKPGDPGLGRLCSPAQESWIKDWPELWVEARSEPAIGRVLARFEDRLRSLNVEYKRLRPPIWRKGEIYLATAQDLSGRVATVNKEVLSTFDAYCYLARIPRTILRGESYRQLSTVLGYAPHRLFGVVKGLDHLQVELTAISTVAEEKAGTSTTNQKWSMGYYPGGKNDEITRTEMRRVLGAGYQCFVDLTPKGEVKPYDRILSEEAAALGLDIEYNRCPIPKGSIPSNPMIVVDALSVVEVARAAGRKVCLHGGRDEIGRPSLVAACWLLDHGWSADRVVTRLAQEWNSPKDLFSEQQLRWIQDWRKQRSELAANWFSKLLEFEKQLSFLMKESEKLRRQARQNGAGERAAIDDLAGRVDVLEEKVNSTIDRWCYLEGVPLGLPRGDLYRQLSEAFGRVPGDFDRLANRFDNVKAELAAISIASQQDETSTSVKSPQKELVDLRLKLTRTVKDCVQRARGRSV